MIAEAGAAASASEQPGATARRDPHRAELFRRLDASCEARRLEQSSPPHFARSPPPRRPPEPPEDDDQPIWPPRSRYWERYKYKLYPPRLLFCDRWCLDFISSAVLTEELNKSLFVWLEFRGFPAGRVSC